MNVHRNEGRQEYVVNVPGNVAALVASNVTTNYAVHVTGHVAVSNVATNVASNVTANVSMKVQWTRNPPLHITCATSSRALGAMESIARLGGFPNSANDRWQYCALN